jgi:hypothetical protein
VRTIIVLNFQFVGAFSLSVGKSSSSSSVVNFCPEMSAPIWRRAPSKIHCPNCEIHQVQQELQMQRNLCEAHTQKIHRLAHKLSPMTARFNS